jgi:hypothetical protein
MPVYTNNDNPSLNTTIQNSRHTFQQIATMSAMEGIKQVSFVTWAISIWSQQFLEERTSIISIVTPHHFT